MPKQAEARSITKEQYHNIKGNFTAASTDQVRRHLPSSSSCIVSPNLDHSTIELRQKNDTVKMKT